MALPAYHIGIGLVAQDIPSVLVVQVLVIAIEQDGRVVSLGKCLQDTIHKVDAPTPVSVVLTTARNAPCTDMLTEQGGCPWLKDANNTAPAYTCSLTAQTVQATCIGV